MVRKIAVTLDHKTVSDLDRWVLQGRYPNRSRALQSAVDLLVEREKRSRLARELAKLDRGEEQRLAEEGLGDEVEGVQPDSGSLLDDRPGGLFPLVPLVAGRPDDVLGEVVDPLLDLQLVLVEVQREFGHGALLRSGPGGPRPWLMPGGGGALGSARLGGHRPPAVRAG